MVLGNSSHEKGHWLLGGGGGSHDSLVLCDKYGYRVYGKTQAMAFVLPGEAKKLAKEEIHVSWLCHIQVCV